MEQKKRQIIQILKSKKGYYNNGRLRKGTNWLASKFNVTPELIKEVVNELKNEKGFELSKVITVKEPIKPIINKPDRLSESNNNINTPGTYWVTGCAHAPFHNKRMYESTFNFLDKEVELSGIILNGDILDMHSISRHNKGKVAIKGVTLDWEYAEANKFLNEIQDLGHNNIIRHYLYGNHEKWHSTALSNVDISKYGKALLSPLEALKLADRGYYVQETYETAHVNIGKHLEINHGEFFNVHCAKKTIDTYRKSVLFNHSHRFQIYTEGLIGGFNMGWGGDVNSPVFNYATRAMKNSWVNASALVTLDKEGGFYVQPLLFLNNKLIVNGKEY